MDSVVHFEMPAKERKRMAEFYTEVFGWETKQLGEDMGNYVLAVTTETDDNSMVKTPGEINGGFYERTDNSMSEHPSIVIGVKNIEESIKKIREKGGKVLGEPNEIPGVGKFVSFVDTEGNRVGVIQRKTG